MFDFHAHILPGIDDGSRDVEESLSMLNALKAQGVDGIAATPHFYADCLSPEQFFEQRRLAWNKLKPYLKQDLPEIKLGAEVRYFEGIDQYGELARFCIDGTNLLLLEMPHGIWTKRMVMTLTELSKRESIIVLLAHIERYLRGQKHETWDYLLRCGIHMQASTDFFTNRVTRRAAMKLLSHGRIHALGTDCHNMTSRVPNMSDAVSIIRRKNSRMLFNLTKYELGLLKKSEESSCALTYAVKMGGD